MDNSIVGRMYRCIARFVVVVRKRWKGRREEKTRKEELEPLNNRLSECYAFDQ